MYISPETTHFIEAHAQDDVRSLALKRAPEGVDLAMALQQIAGRQVAQQKLPAWAATKGLLYPPHLSLEQCSSEWTAKRKQQIMQEMLQLVRSCTLSSSSPSPFSTQDESGEKDGGRLVDLTGGLGVDFSFMASLFSSADYVECQSSLCALAQHNFPLLGLSHARVHCAEAQSFLAQMGTATCIFLDPARRSQHGGRTYALDDCTPNVLPLLPLLLERAPLVLLKLSPMLDITQVVRQLHESAGRSVVAQVHVLAHRGECKELFVVLSAHSVLCSSPSLCCTDERSHFATPLNAQTFTRQFPLLSRWPSAGEWLFEPNPSVMKAQCFAPLCHAYGLQAVGAESHLFVAPSPLPHFPGRQLHLRAVSTLARRQVRSHLAQWDRARVAVRHFPLTAAQLRQRLRLAEGGTAHVFGTTASDGTHLLLWCEEEQ